MIEKEQVRRGAGELLLLGPGLPHWGVIDKFPLSYITVYFLPWVLVELGPESDGVWILRRFTVQQPAAQRVMRFPPKYRAEFRHRFEEIYHEFSQLGLGREVRLRTLLMECSCACCVGNTASSTCSRPTRRAMGSRRAECR